MKNIKTYKIFESSGFLSNLSDDELDEKIKWLEIEEKEIRSELEKARKEYKSRAKDGWVLNKDEKEFIKAGGRNVGGSYGDGYLLDDDGKNMYKLPTDFKDILDEVRNTGFVFYIEYDTNDKVVSIFSYQDLPHILMYVEDFCKNGPLEYRNNKDHISLKIKKN